MSWIVCEFNKGKSAAVTYLCREHETELLCCHLWRKIQYPPIAGKKNISLADITAIAIHRESCQAILEM